MTGPHKHLGTHTRLDEFGVWALVAAWKDKQQDIDVLVLLTQPIDLGLEMPVEDNWSEVAGVQRVGFLDAVNEFYGTDFSVGDFA